MTLFGEVWPLGPWLPRGKKAAQRHYQASVKTEGDFLDFMLAREVYIAELKRDSWRRPMHGSTFFNQWRDYLTETPKPALFAPIERINAPFLCAGHLCDLCEPSHRYDCFEPETCGMSENVICPKGLESLR